VNTVLGLPKQKLCQYCLKKRKRHFMWLVVWMFNVCRAWI